MQLVDQSISLAELKEMSEKMFGDMVKAVVDIEKGIMVVDAPMHVDEEQFLLEHDSNQEYSWDINLFPDKFGRQEFVVKADKIYVTFMANDKVCVSSAMRY